MGLRHIFSDKPIPKIIDFLLVHRSWDYPVSTIAEAAGASYHTLQKIVPLLVRKGILRETREVGKAKLYALDFESPSVKKLDEFALTSDIEFSKKGSKQIILVR